MKTNKILIPALMLSLFVTPYVFAENSNNNSSSDNQNKVEVSNNQDQQNNNEALKQQQEKNREQNKQDLEKNQQDNNEQDQEDQQDNEDQNIVTQLDNTNDFNYVDSIKIEKGNINKYSDVVTVLNQFKDALTKIKDATNIQSTASSTLTDAEKALLGKLVSQNKGNFDSTNKNIDELNSYIDQYVTLLTPLADTNISKYIKGFLMSELNNIKDLISNEQDLAKEAINSVIYTPVTPVVPTTTLPAVTTPATTPNTTN